MGSLLQLAPAANLAEIDDTLRPIPLSTPDEIAAFYSHKYNEARGSDRIAQLGVKLSRCFDRGPFHGFVAGHPGVGKSTEISRLILKYENKFRAIRISAAGEMFPGDFRLHDLLWLMTVRVLECARSPEISGFSEAISPALLEAVRNELSERWIERLGLKQADLETGLDQSFFVRLKATLKVSRQQTEKVTVYSHSELRDLIAVVNRVFNESNDVLRKEKAQEWLVVIEDFEKFGVDTEQLRRLFLDNALILEQLRCHLLFVIPVGLAYTEEAEHMPFGREGQFMIPDIAVINRDHEVDPEGVEALLEVLYRRMHDGLLDRKLAADLAVASGGNIRDLFDLLRRAALAAEVRGGTSIVFQDAEESVRALRHDYVMRLGENPFGKVSEISLEDKLQKLEAIYNGNPQAEVPDRVLYLLLRQRIVLQFNGEGWYGVHPLVVDRLKDFGLSLKPDAPGGTVFRGN